jgi:hypothetical protein
LKETTGPVISLARYTIAEKTDTKPVRNEEHDLSTNIISDRFEYLKTGVFISRAVVWLRPIKSATGLFIQAV